MKRKFEASEMWFIQMLRITWTGYVSNEDVLMKRETRILRIRKRQIPGKMMRKESLGNLSLTEHNERKALNETHLVNLSNELLYKDARTATERDSKVINVAEC